MARMGLPVDLQPSAGPALVAGGGTVATRRVEALVAGGFAITVVAPEVSPAIRGLPGVTVCDRSFQPGDIAGCALVFACTSDRRVNEQIGALCRAANVPVSVADRRAESTFHLPAVHREGALAVAISTGGGAPALAAEIRDRVAAALGAGWGDRVAAARSERDGRLAAVRAESRDG